MAKPPHPVDVHIGRRIRERRMLMGLSQEQLARLLGVTFQQIQKYERGTNRVGASRLVELARILQVPVTWFFEGLEGAGGETSAAAAGGLAEPGAEFTFDVPEARPPGPGPRWRGLDRREILELVRAYDRIGDPLVRRRVYELVRALAEVRWREGD